MSFDKDKEVKMRALQEAKTSKVMNLLKTALDKDSEIKSAIYNDTELLTKILQMNIIDEIKQDLKIQKLIMKFDFHDEKRLFLEKFSSENTRSSYNYALLNFELYCNEHGLQSPIGATPANIDAWLLDQVKVGKSPATVRRNCGAVSAFFSYIERKSNNELRNPVKGTDARPKNVNTKKTKFYSMGTVDSKHLEQIAEDVKTIIEHERNKEFKAIITIMAYRGLRCGAFEQMVIHGEQFRTVSKGEEVKGILPAICLEALDKADIKHNEPFPTWTSNRVKQNVKNHCNKLYSEGLISFKYSAHDFRHFFALSEYEKNHDIYSLSKLLNHSGIAITEKYLRGLHVEI